jgi:hypothetical protein
VKENLKVKVELTWQDAVFVAVVVVVELLIQLDL